MAWNTLSNDDILLKAMQNNEFILYYQPIVGEALDVLWFEALIRWNNPVIGIVSPDLFIPSLEENNLIVLVGTWVLREACSQLKKWQNCNHVNCGISVNVSSLQLHQQDFEEVVYNILIETKLNPECLLLEITESIDSGLVPNIVRTLENLINIGVRISIDDFGTGYNSLKYLHEIEFSNLKIDKFFVSNLNTSRGKILVDTIISLSHRMGVKVVAEGVESAEQYSLLKDMKCDMFQGYYFSKPLPADEIYYIKEKNGLYNRIKNNTKFRKLRNS